MGPEYECPKCGIVYAKFDPDSEAKKKALRARAANKIFASPSSEKIETADSEKVSNHQNSMFMIKIMKAYSGLFEIIRRNKLAKIIAYAISILVTSLLVKFIFGEKVHQVFTLLLVLGIFGWVAVKITEKLSSFKKNSSDENELPETPKITACRTCGQTVAFTAKTCPHCGESKPAPQIKKSPTQVTKKHLIVAGIVCFLILLIASNPEKPVTGEEVLARCTRELGMNINSSAPVSMHDIYAIDKCLNKYGINTKSK